MSIIRRLQPEDCARLAEIEKLCFSLPWSEEDFRKLLTHSYCTYLVAEEDGEPVGFCGYTNLCGEADIDHVFVAPEFRGKKLAQRLMREILKTGGEDGVEAYTLAVRVSNAPAIHLYEKFGFVSEGIRPGFYDYPREDALIMWRRPV